MSQATPPQPHVPEPIVAIPRDDGPLSTDVLIAACEARTQALKGAVVGLSCDPPRARPVAGRWSTRNVLSAFGVLIVLATAVSADEPRPFPGAVSRWNGFVRHDFRVDGANVIVVEPQTPLPGRPWAWRGEFFGAFPNADIELLKHGWHLAYIGVPDQFGSPTAMRTWERLHDVLVREHGLSPRPALIGLSRGALYCMSWAALHPDRTLLVYLDNGVCDFKSWPGGKPKGLGTGAGSPPEWTKLLKAYGFRDDREAIAYDGNPVDRLMPLAEAKIPMLLVYGDSDGTVPHRENSEVVYERYRALGGPVERIVKSGVDHHPHGLSDPRPIVEFFERTWQNQDQHVSRTRPEGGDNDE